MCQNKLAIRSEIQVDKFHPDAAATCSKYFIQKTLISRGDV